jgi:ribonucleoside-diphosphate reductase alpha chain
LRSRSRSISRRQSDGCGGGQEAHHEERLQNRRASELLEVESLKLRFTVGTSNYPDGRLAEIFITNHRAGSDAGILASEAAICASLALQFGCPLDILRKALARDSQGRATSPLGIALDLIAEQEGKLMT